MRESFYSATRERTGNRQQGTLSHEGVSGLTKVLIFMGSAIAVTYRRDEDGWGMRSLLHSDQSGQKFLFLPFIHRLYFDALRWRERILQD